jgi:uroporphyrinogen-III synthase
MPKNACYISIGPETSKTARLEGIDTILEAEEHTIDGLVAAIVSEFKTRNQ